MILFDLDENNETLICSDMGLFKNTQDVGWVSLMSQTYSNEYRIHLNLTRINEKESCKGKIIPIEVFGYIRLDDSQNVILNRYKRIRNLLDFHSQINSNTKYFHGSKEERINQLIYG